MNSEQYALALHQMVDGQGETRPAGPDGDSPSELRSTLAAPDAFLEQFFGGVGTTTAGVIVNEQTALTSAAVWQAVRILSEAVASLPFLIYMRLAGGGRDKNLAHPLFQILDVAPNDEMSAFTFRETLMGNVLLWGNGYAEIERDNAGDPIGMHWLRPDRVVPTRNPLTRKLEYKVLQTNKPEAIIAKEDMFHVKGLCFDGLQGYGVVRLARQSMGVGMAAEASSAGFFGNGVRTQGILKHPGTLKEPAINNLRNSFREMYGGPYQSGKPLVLEEGLEFIPMTMPMRDAQFLESREFQVEEIARWFNLPPHKLGKMERATNNNIEQQSIDFVVHSVRPWLVRMEAEVLLKLFSEQERQTLYAEHNVDALLRGDIMSRYTAYSTAINNGFMLLDEAREIENRNPLENGMGKIALVSVNAQPLSVVAAVSKLADQGVLPSGADGNQNNNKGASSPGGAGAVPREKQAGGGPGGGKDAAKTPKPDATIDDTAADDPEGRSEFSAGEGTGATNHRGFDFKPFEKLVVSAADRAVRRETEVLARAAKKGDFAAYLPKFYEEQGKYLRAQLDPVIETMAGLANGDGERIRTVWAGLPGKYVEQSMGELRAVIDAADPDDFETVIEPVLERWKRERAVDLAARLSSAI